ncbi:MAG: hypothetical protein HRU26_15980 [Psychroserpens sp.]|nr:hypothetical protein [Psychroserpens sp.]
MNKNEIIKKLIEQGHEESDLKGLNKADLQNLLEPVASDKIKIISKNTNLFRLDGDILIPSAEGFGVGDYAQQVDGEWKFEKGK